MNQEPRTGKKLRTADLEPRTQEKFLVLSPKFKVNLGFTLVELLVVIAVISMITALLFPNFMGVRQRARDSQRKSDLAQIQKALELYKLDNITSYPTIDEVSLSFPSSLCNKCWSQAGIDNCTTNLYLRKFPCDPSDGATPYIYTLDSGDALKYTLSACLENLADPDKDLAPVPACQAASKASYTIHEP